MQGSEAAERVRRKFNIESVTEELLRQWVEDVAHTTYLLDVRSSEEYSESTLERLQIRARWSIGPGH